MKKLILIAALALGVTAAQAQVTVQGSKFTDNWSLGVKAGMTTPVKNHAFIGCARGLAGFELKKQITPTFGLGADVEFTFNTSSWFENQVKSWNMVDHQYVGVFGSINLMNAFAGYKGAPRAFEMELTAGTGWLHAYNPSKNIPGGWDGNTWANKVGLNFNFNLGAEKAWTVGVKPAILWNMGSGKMFNQSHINGLSAQYNANRAAFELTAGLTYHFKNSNGTHSFVVARLYDQAEVDGLNAQINSLRNDLENCNANNASLQAKVNNLQAELDACNRRPAVVKEVVKNLNNVRYVFFRQGSSVIQENQKPNLELIANSVAENEGSTVTIEGYASPEGSKAFNQRLSERRAEAVKKALVSKYNISADAIATEGKGVGDIFNAPSWNRMAKCTVNVK